MIPDSNPFYPQSVVEIPRLEYRHARGGCGDSLVPYALAALVGMMVFSYIAKTEQTTECVRYARDHVSAMMSSASNRISARLTAVSSASVEASLPDIHDLDNAKKFLSTHPKSVVMIYAPWCGHCKVQKPEFKTMCSKSSVPCALLNADSIGTDALSKLISGFSLKHFPTFLSIKDGASSKEGSIKEVFEDAKLSGPSLSARKVQQSTHPQSLRHKPALTPVIHLKEQKLGSDTSVPSSASDNSAPFDGLF